MREYRNPVLLKMSWYCFYSGVSKCKTKHVMKTEWIEKQIKVVLEIIDKKGLTSKRTKIQLWMTSETLGPMKERRNSTGKGVNTGSNIKQYKIRNQSFGNLFWREIL